MKRSITQYLNGNCIGGAATMPPVFEDLVDALLDHIQFEGGLTTEAKTRKGKPNRKMRITISMEEVK